MLHIENKKILPYNIEVLYQIIYDVEKYSEFIPWFKEVVIQSKKDNSMITSVKVQFAFITESYISMTKFQPPCILNDKTIAKAEVVMIEGPFDNFSTIWFLEKINEGETLIELKCNFMFTKSLYSKIASFALQQMNKKIIDAFIKRIKTLNTGSPVN